MLKQEAAVAKIPPLPAREMPQITFAECCDTGVGPAYVQESVTGIQVRAAERYHTNGQLLSKNDLRIPGEKFSMLHSFPRWAGKCCQHGCC